jgi:hypothetical protein
MGESPFPTQYLRLTSVLVAITTDDGMKKLTLTFIFLCGLGAFVFAGAEPYSGKDKEIMQPAPAPCEWYRAHEWDLDLWGTWAFSANSGSTDRSDEEPSNEPIGFIKPGVRIPLGTAADDRFLARDNTWGGGVDVKYFFSKYWALGVEGIVLDAERNIAGGAFGTFTIRYPIGCSRFAPYAWVGGGVLAGGGSSQWFFNLKPTTRNGIPVDVEFNDVGGVANKHAEAAFQGGTGLEYRITPRVGLMGDFAWNVVSGPDNNFGLVRFGATLSY